MSSQRFHRERGDISVLLALLLLTVMTGSALVLGAVLSRQLRLSGDIVASERAYYAASAGLEEGLYRVNKQFEPTVDLSLATPITYVQSDGGSEEASISGAASIFDTIGGVVCVRVEGSFRSADRRLAAGPEDCGL